MIRVMSVDDQAVVRAGFHVLLEEHGDIAVVSEATGSREAVAAVAREHPDVVCMDLWMPAGDGLMATRQIVASRQDGSPAVLAVTTFDLDADVLGTLEAGTDGFILKDYGPEELVDAVRRLATGHGLVDHTITRRVITEFARRHAPAGNTTEIRKLTARKLEIVKLLAAGMSNAEIVTELAAETSTMKSHPTRTPSRIGARDRTQMVVWAHRNGLAGWSTCPETGRAALDWFLGVAEVPVDGVGAP